MRLRSALLLLATPTLLAAQAAPKGWQTHLDRANMPKDFALTTMGTGMHVKTGSAAGVAFDPSIHANAPYRIDASFTQMKAPMHPEAYGVVFGGTALDTDKAEYYYFVVRGDGKYLVKHHANNGDVHTIVDWTASPALKVADAAGKATNALVVDVGRDSTRFSANGKRVGALAIHPDGIAGVRVNHQLDVHIDGFKLSAGK